jgi:phosphoribosylformylglycinamidine synthase
MQKRLEITLKNELSDAEGEGLKKKAGDYFGLAIDAVRTIHIATFDVSLTDDQFEEIKNEAFTNPVIQVSSYDPLDIDFDWCIWVGFRPGVRDNAGSTAIEAIEDIIGIKTDKNDCVFTSKRYCIKASGLNREDVDKIAGELLANNIIQQWKIFSAREWDKKEGIGIIIPKVILDHEPTVSSVSAESIGSLKQLSDERNLALNVNDIPVIMDYFNNDEVLSGRINYGLSDPTDIELEYISQARSDHCNHNTFQGLFTYKDLSTGESVIEDNIFKKYIKEPTLALQKKKDWVVSVLWDNAGVGRFDENTNYVITGETHNSPSNMEAYGGAITGIVGVYRDPLGTGLGAKLIMGSYGFCTGPRDYDGELTPHLHPKRLLDGIIEGVKDGGNKSGVPTTFGQLYFDSGYIGKSLVFVTAVGMMPARINGKPSHEKKTEKGDLIIMCGGRVGKDGIHGVTASSEVFSANTPAGHVQIGDPYTQKKMHDFILEVRDEGIIEFITDNGGGGLSSSIGESAELSNGCEVNLEKVPLKYEGLDQWEIWISESQERMTVAIKPQNLDRFMALSKKHAVESTVIGKYTDTGKLHIKYNDKTCACVDMDLLSKGFPQWKFDAHWLPPQYRGLYEPVVREPVDYNALIIAMLQRQNICSREWITRQYDHEVQGTSVMKPLVGKNRDVGSDASVIRPVPGSEKGLAFSQSLLPSYSAIDAYHMTTCTIDEAVRRLVAVGGDPEHIGGVDNFCWPDIQYDPVKNPDGKFKAAQLVRSCRALKNMCEAYGVPLLSGKDSMYVDGHLPGKYGQTIKVSALETMQFSAISLVNDVTRCVSMDLKSQGDILYIVGATKNELGASEYYEMFGKTGLNVPEVNMPLSKVVYRAVHKAIGKEVVSAVHGIYRGGLGLHLALMAMAGETGVQLNLDQVPFEGDASLKRNDVLLFSETPGRFLVTVPDSEKHIFEKLMSGLPVKKVGVVTDTDGNFVVTGVNGSTIINAPVNELKTAWKQPFGDLI